MPFRPNDDRDADVPEGDGTADVTSTVQCPYCAAAVTVVLDPNGGGAQEYVEDCNVCCRPWRVTVRYGRDGAAVVELARLDE